LRHFVAARILDMEFYSRKVANVVARTNVVNLVVNLRHTYSCRIPPPKWPILCRVGR